MKTIRERLLAVLADQPLPPVRPRPHARHKSWAELVSYDEACQAVRAAGLKTGRDFTRWYKTPENVGLPARPDKFYSGKGWQDWSKFLTAVNRVEFVSYEKACKIVREAGIDCRPKFRVWVKAQPDVPSRPDSFYNGTGWEGWTKFLTGTAERELVSYAEASMIVQHAGVRTKDHFMAWIKTHKDTGVASSPASTYAGQWQSWPEFLTGQTQLDSISYDEACSVVRDAGVTTRSEFSAWIRTNGIRSGKTKTCRGVPASPERIYAGQWESWPKFLGTKTSSPQKKFVSYDEACRIVRNAGVKSSKEFNLWIKSHRTAGVPSGPHRTYASKGWQGWSVFLDNRNHICQKLVACDKTSSSEMRA
jgi:hypothetical protein